MSIAVSYSFTQNTVADPDQVNQNFTDVLTAIKGAHHSDGDGTKITNTDINTDWGLVPKGGIMIWSGSIASIPTGYLLCDGNNSTPDLRNKFVIGAGGDYAVDASGGSATADLYHQHQVDNHTHGISADGSHQHYIAGTTGANSAGYKVNGGSNNTVADQHTHNFAVYSDWQGYHSHGGATGGATPYTSFAGSSLQSILPPYLSKAYIMKS